jgi:hypothetical protein
MLSTALAKKAINDSEGSEFLSGHRHVPLRRPEEDGVLIAEQCAMLPVRASSTLLKSRCRYRKSKCTFVFNELWLTKTGFPFILKK